jgi:ribonuclease HI
VKSEQVEAWIDSQVTTRGSLGGWMAQKKSRQTFGKRKREQAVKERRVRKEERKAAARLAKAEGVATPVRVDDGAVPDHETAATEDG